MAVFQDPRQHGRGGGLAVRAGHCQRPFVVQNIFQQPLRAGDIGQAAIENFLHQRIAACDHVANHKQIRCERNLLRIETFDQAYALRFELRAHRRIDIGVAAGDGVPGLLRQDRDAAHKGAANTKNMNAHSGSAKIKSAL